MERPSAKKALASCGSNRSWKSIFGLMWIGGLSLIVARHPAKANTATSTNTDGILPDIVLAVFIGLPVIV